jgi:hypothetical protein
MQVKPDKPPPPILKLGAGAHYIRLDVLADMMGTTEKGIRTLLATLDHIPIAHFPGMSDSRYVLVYAFETAMFALGMPKTIKENADLLRVHQELAGVLYGALTKEALRERVKAMIRGLTSAGDKAIIGKRRKRTRDAYKTWPGRNPS